MGWFNKKQKEDKRKGVSLLPELPKLPELPDLKENVITPKTPLHQLPSFPTNSIGKKFSQDNIREAITGKKDDDEISERDYFTSEEDSIQIKQKPLRNPRTKEMPSSKKVDVPKEFKEVAKKVESAEPVFIRIDKFEESLEIFKETKSKILDIEKMLRDIKSIKEEEEKELEEWYNEVQTMKTQIERVDKDIFSKIE